MQLAQRMDMLIQLQSYMLGNDVQWEAIKEKAYLQNGWFIPQFIDLSVRNIATHLLSRRHLQEWVDKYNVPPTPKVERTVGVVMPGNIPLEGFYDFLCVFLSGHSLRIKLSPTDDVLLKHLAQQLTMWDSSLSDHISIEDMLKGCDAYIATAKHIPGPLEQYFSKYPNIIHRNSSATAILSGKETRQQLELLADDVFQYFGRGCLNVTKLYVPQKYDFIPLLKAFDKYAHLIDHNKYKNNYDYHLALLLLNKEFYMTNGCILLTENKSPVSPVSRLHYEYYSDEEEVLNPGSPDARQSLVGTHQSPLGRAQQSVICERGEPETLQFLLKL